ncbi:ScyD/ScyE family protein [Nocardioides sp.]|jgi:glucose/arabinose dehydrogenase|uniref:ScyD/ScyE family protein n=1 Tax=Nocardioides sp. TaxID=35761 RepID=UPI0031FF1358|nr:hypothetical protein [Nocardioides sp.]
MQRKTLITAAVAAAALATAGTMSTATATAARSGSAPHRSVVTKNLFSPLSFAVRSNGTAYIAQNFIGQLLEKKPGEPSTLVFQAKGGSAEGPNEVGAVSVRNGVVTFAVTSATGGVIKQATKTDGKWVIKTIADVGAFEKTQNPDAGSTYGFESIPDECAAQIDPAVSGPPTYTGIIDAHPYGTASTADTIYVADAAANAILEIDGQGTVSELTVLPVVPAVVTAEAAASAGFPDCTIGLTYDFEPVPTDVEVGSDGSLYVSSLPGGPEDGSAGALGAVYRVHPQSGHATKVVSGLISATGVAVAPNGDLYVSELFAGQIAKIPAGADEAQPFRSFPLPAAVELQGGQLYATVNALPSDGPPAGRLVKLGL